MHLLVHASHVVHQALRQHHLQGKIHGSLSDDARAPAPPFHDRGRLSLSSATDEKSAGVEDAHVDVQEAEEGEDVVVPGHERPGPKERSGGV